MNLCIVHMDTDNVVLCVTDPELDKEMHTATEPGAIVSTTIKHLSTTTAELDSPWLPYRKHNFDGSKQKIWLLDRQSADCCGLHRRWSFIYSQLWSKQEKKRTWVLIISLSCDAAFVVDYGKLWNDVDITYHKDDHSETRLWSLIVILPFLLNRIRHNMKPSHVPTGIRFPPANSPVITAVASPSSSHPSSFSLTSNLSHPSPPDCIHIS